MANATKNPALTEALSIAHHRAERAFRARAAEFIPNDPVAQALEDEAQRAKAAWLKSL